MVETSRQVERIIKLRALTVEHGATPAEAETAAEIAQRLEDALEPAELSELSLEESHPNKDWWEYEDIEETWRGIVYRERAWTVTPDGVTFTTPMGDFTERLRRRMPYG